MTGGDEAECKDGLPVGMLMGKLSLLITVQQKICLDSRRGLYPPV